MSPGDIKSSKLTSGVIEALQQAVGKENVEVCDGKCNGSWACVKPENAKEVSKIILIGKKNGAKVVSSNNPSWAVDGTPADGGIFVDLSKFSPKPKVDPVSLSVRVGAGTDLKTVAEAVAEKGFTLGSHPADPSFQIGRWAVTDGVGFGSYKYGSSKDNVLSLRVVTDEGAVIETGYDDIGAYMSGYNLNDLFAASEGTLGVVVEATLKIHPKGIDRLVAYRFESAFDMQSAFNEIAQHPSVKPRDISWCGRKLTILATLDGEERHVDLEEKAIDDALGKIGARIEKDDACGICRAICGGKKEGAVEAVVPLKDWKAFSESVSASYGTIADRGTAHFVISGESIDSVHGKASSLGGRALGRDVFKWSPAAPVGTAKKDLPRKVTGAVIAELEEAVGKDNVTNNGVELVLYSKDMAPLPKEAGIAFNNVPDLVVRPSDVKGLSETVRIACKHGIPVVPRGNSSWGLGGCMPACGGIVVDMSSKFNKVLEINTEELYVKVGTGCTWKALLDACMKKGYIIGSYPSSFPSATLGAWIATNGMGIGSYKYGAAKDNILNMELVLSDGSVLETGNEHVGSYGAAYNLNRFFSGSEGTLCVFGTVTFRIYPFGSLKPLAYSFEKLSDMQAAITAVSNHPSVKPLHIAFEDEMHFANQRKAGGHAPDAKSILLVTFQGSPEFNDLDAEEMDAIAVASKGSRIGDDIGAHEWQERCYEFRARMVGVGEIPAEVIVPNSKWGAFVGECYAGFKTMKMEPGGVIGVVVDRNTSLFMPYYFKDDESLLGMTAFAFNFFLGGKAAGYGGRTTGFGVFFAWNLDNIHDAQTVDYMRGLKTTLDPRDVVNPGHLVCGKTRFGISMNKQLMTVGSSVMQLAKKILPANTTFDDNIKRFRYNTLEHRREEDRFHTLGDGTQ
ncbi:MAG: FAD-binding oxidoreductase [Candidatus Methanoplasma sp.]|jgi:glycolate oxidase|nr:FAD-binding oxidoreductase [Candidatus Methanoplasma sp.]